MADTIERLSTCARQLLDAGAEIARLRAELIAAQADLHIMTGYRDGLVIISREMEADRDRLAAALKEYGLHKWDCPENDGPTDAGFCTCGLQGLLDEQSHG